MSGCCIADCCIKNCCILDCCIMDFGGSSCGYYPGPSETEAHATKIANELAEMKEKIGKSSEAIEQKIIDDIGESINDLIKMLENVNKERFGNKSLNINISEIRTNNEKLKKEVVGYIGEIMNDRLVLTDKELSVILAERDDKKRGGNFDTFCIRVKKQALDGLGKKIETTVREQEKMIRREIEARLNEVKQNMEAAMKAYTDIVNLKEKDESKIAVEQIKYMYRYELSKILLDQLGE